MIEQEWVKFVIERSCLRKQNLTEEKANHVVDMEAARGHLIYFYHCSFCNSYHLTSSPPKEPAEKDRILIN